MVKLLKSGEISEDTIHHMIVQYLNLKGYGNYIVAPCNEYSGMKKRGRNARLKGMRPGASDLFIAVPRHDTHGLWMEIKSKKGKLSEHQMKFFVDMEFMNYMTATVYSFDEAKEFLDWYLD